MHSPIKQAIAEIKAGKMIIVTDDEGRENEGDIIFAAEFANQEKINFMAKEARGLICLALSEHYHDKLGLKPMVNENNNPLKTAFSISIEAASGVTTGISAKDRAHTIQTAINDHASPKSIVSPGHIFPLKANPWGVLARAGHTEAGVDLCHLAGLKDAAVICEIMNEDGTMARGESLEQFAKIHGLSIYHIKDLINYRIRQDNYLEKTASAKLPTEYGNFDIEIFTNKINQQEITLVYKNRIQDKAPLVRIHSACSTGDIFGSKRCDCGDQLKHALQAINREGGYLIYLPQEGRGIGLSNKIKAYALQQQGFDTVEANEKLGFHADEREYTDAVQLLKYLKLETIRLLTNNPKKISSMESFGINIEKRVPIKVGMSRSNAAYLQCKQEKLAHLLG